MHRSILATAAVVSLAASVSYAKAQDYRVYDPKVTCKTAMANVSTKKNDAVVSVDTYIKITMGNLDSRQRENGQFAFLSLVNDKTMLNIVSAVMADCRNNPKMTLFNASVDTYTDARNFEISKDPAH